METQTQPIVKAGMFETHESCRCQRCDGAIPRINVAANIDTQSGIQTVRAYCDHCKVLWVAKRRLTYDGWQIQGEVEAIEDGKKLKGFQARIAHLRGDRTVEALAS